MALTGITTRTPVRIVRLPENNCNQFNVVAKLRDVSEKLKGDTQIREVLGSVTFALRTRYF